MSGNVRRLELIRALFWTHFVAAVLIPFYTEWGGLTLTQVLTLNAWFMAWNFVLEIPTGAVADVFGRRWSIVLGAAVSAAATLVYVSAPRFEVFLVAEVVFALGYTLVSGADEALLYDSLAADGRAERAPRHLARLQAAQLVGIVVGALGGGLIAAAWGLRAPLACTAIPMGLAALLATTLVEPPVRAARSRVASYRTTLVSGLRRLAHDRRLRVVAADAVVVGAFVWMLIWLYQPLLARAGVSASWFGPAHATLCVAQIVVLRSVDRLLLLAGGRARYLRAAAALPGLAMLGLAWPVGPAVTMGLLLVGMGLGLSRTPIATTVFAAGADPEGRATLLSTVSMLRTLAICLVNPIAGALADRSLGLALGTLGAATLAVAVCSPLRERHLGD